VETLEQTGVRPGGDVPGDDTPGQSLPHANVHARTQAPGPAPEDGVPAGEPTADGAQAGEPAADGAPDEDLRDRDARAGSGHEDGTTASERAVVAWLVDRGQVDAAAVERARRVRSEHAGHLHVLLTKLGLVSEADLAQALATVLGLPLAGPDDYPDEPLAEHPLSEKFLKNARLLPLMKAPEGIVVAMADPLDDFAAHAVEVACQHPVVRWIAVPADLERAFDRLYAAGGAVAGDAAGIDEVGLPDADEDAERLKDLASEAPVIKLVNRLISQAVEARASDIHIEPFEAKLRVRYRVDSILREVESPPSKLKAAIVSRIKIMAKLNIAERRLPQDGRVKLAVRGRDIDFRVSTLPTMHGESVVMRILDKSSATFEFAALGFDAETLAAYLKVLEQPNGILLVTGPTGSGKTTTLYTSLLRLNTPDKKLITVEDPIEYQLEGVNQIQVKNKVGLSFAYALRSILRQDPDIIMIGEIRDKETAQIAAQAALTGHVVLSTLHTNSAASSITRLLDMGLEDYLLASTVNGITAQRLVRTLCPHCREPHPALDELVEDLGLERFASGPIVHFHPVGCAACGGTGYFGRTGISEILVMTDEVRRLALRRADAQDIQKIAVNAGMRTLYEDGVRKALQGVTSLEEVLRATREN
jgi:general secretion pathway protein E